MWTGFDWFSPQLVKGVSDLTDLNKNDVKKLVYTLDQPITDKFSSLTGITFSNLFTPYVLAPYLPHLLPSLKKVHFGPLFNGKLCKMPHNISALAFGNRFNQPLADFLPENLNKLNFGRKFNQPIHNCIFPKNLCSLVFGDEFNQPVDTFLPPDLLVLKFGENFNQSLDHLPPSLHFLDLGGHFGTFNRALDNLPNNLQTLHLSRVYSHSLDHLPDSITRILLVIILICKLQGI